MASPPREVYRITRSGFQFRGWDGGGGGVSGTVSEFKEKPERI